MARNYCEFYLARINQGGNYFSFARETAAEVQADLDFFTSHFGGTVDIPPSKAYFLISKANVAGLFNTATVHYTSMWGSSWNFLQDGLIAHSSPRGKRRTKWHSGP